MFFEFGLERKGLDSPRVPLPKSYQTLVVEKPIGIYEPASGHDEIKKF